MRRRRTIREENSGCEGDCGRYANFNEGKMSEILNGENVVEVSARGLAYEVLRNNNMWTPTGYSEYPAIP
jgi:hypothetical protein